LRTSRARVESLEPKLRPVGIVTEIGSLRAPGLPVVVLSKIATFLAAGTTGQIVLDVKEGRILAYKLTESGRVGNEIDSNGQNGHD
jgi:hypothetical protein